jgi:hypothetical protein
VRQLPPRRLLPQLPCAGDQVKQMNTDERRQCTATAESGKRKAESATRLTFRVPLSAFRSFYNLCSSVCICGSIFLACGSGADPQSENYGNLLASPGGLVVLEEEHPTGWGCGRTASAVTTSTTCTR